MDGLTSTTRISISHVWLAAACLLLAVLSAGGCQKGGPEQHLIAAASIRAKYDSAIDDLEPEDKRHYAVRLFRMTGEGQYRQPVAADLGQTLELLEDELAGAADVQYRTARAFDLLNEFSEVSRKGRLRRTLFGQQLDMLFALDVLTNAKRVSEHLQPGPTLDSLVSQWNGYLSTVDFESFLLDRTVVKTFAPQAANFVYYLHRLGIVDLRDQFKEAFQIQFPDARDEDLSPAEFRDKVYGLTHFILAASDYYQTTVDSTEYAWVLNYCRGHSDRIFDETTPDIIAEVGLCFLLTGHRDDRVVERCQDAVQHLIDDDNAMILSPSGSNDLSAGEHRNVLAIMLLNWPDTLFAGPRLAAPASD